MSQSETTRVKNAKSISLFLPSMAGGGAERVMTYLANGIADRGHHVDMVLIEKQGPYLADLSPNVHVTDLGARGVRSAIVPLARYLRSRKPDVLIPALDHVNAGALLAKRLACAATPVIPTVHISYSRAVADWRGLRHAIIKAAVRRTYRWANAIVAVSNGVAEDMVKTVGVPRHLIRVIYNPVITPQMRALAQAPLDHPWFVPEAPPVIVAMGRLTAQKDFPMLLRAAARLRQQMDFRLMILGEGEERGRLEQMVQDLSLTREVSLPGFVDNPFAYVARASLFVMSSAWEGLPLVLIEALAVGTPVVSTDCPSGPMEILDGGKHGRLVPVGDADALAAAMKATLSEPRHSVPDEVLRPFTLESAVDNYISLIDEVTSR